MSILAELHALSAAEDFFAALDVPYEQAVLNVARLHILRRMGQYLAEADLPADNDAAARLACRQHLLTAYQDFVRSSPIAERVFKVHQDAVTPQRAFVPLSSLSEPAEIAGSAS